MLKENIPGKGRDGENLKAGPETKKQFILDGMWFVFEMLEDESRGHG